MFSEGRYKLYGLSSGNPYAGRALDSLALENDRELLLELRGFIRLATIEAALKNALKKKRPAFFLITGVGNSGRTSLANHVMYLYRQTAAANLPRYTFVVHSVERDDMMHDAYSLLLSTLLSLRNKMDDNSIEIPLNLRRLFAELSRRGTTDPMNEYDLQQIAQFTAAAFDSHNAGFGILYEGVSTKELLTQATKVFENTSTVVVFTVDTYQHASTVQLTTSDRQLFAKRGLVFDLSTLTPKQIAALADGRWTGYPPSPFEAQGVENVFSQRPFTIGQAMRYLEILLDCRLSEYESDEPWPVEDLHMPDRWLQLKMWQSERWNGMRGFHG